MSSKEDKQRLASINDLRRNTATASEQMVQFCNVNGVEIVNYSHLVV